MDRPGGILRKMCGILGASAYRGDTDGHCCIFDRSLVDAISALVYEEPDRAESHLKRLQQYRYANAVFIAPPWPELFENDPERRHNFSDAVAEYDRLVNTYSMAGYSIIFLLNPSDA